MNEENVGTCWKNDTGKGVVFFDDSSETMCKSFMTWGPRITSKNQKKGKDEEW